MKPLSILLLIAYVFTSCNNSSTPQQSVNDSISTKREIVVDTIAQNGPVKDSVIKATVIIPKANHVPNEKLDKIINYISGIKNNEEEFKKVEGYAYWNNYTMFIDSSWKSVKSKRLDKMQVWAQTELAEANKTDRTIFYPFSGPDFLNAFVLFPNAKTYYLLALEPPGSLPDIRKFNELMAEEYFDNLKISLNDIFGKSYFITRKMTKQLQSGLVDGTLPLITFFMKKTGNTIVDIRKVSIDSSGNSIEIPYEAVQLAKSRPRGIRIDFYTSNSKEIKTVYYYSCDLSDGAFNTKNKFYKYLSKLGDVTTYLKSASYVLHYSMFVNIRNFILAKSKFLLQDDTGIPLKAFNKKEWILQLYGKYVKPVKDFDGVDQADLKLLYETDKTLKPLPFALGYHWGSKDNNLMRAIKK